MKFLITLIPLFILALPLTAEAQYMDVQINVEPEVLTSVEQDLDFGLLITGTGFQEIPLGSPSMGIFRIRALQTQSLILNIEYEGELRSTDPDIVETIPFELNASYTSDNRNDFRESRPMNGATEEIIIEQSNRNPDSEWSGVYLYMYGGIMLGNIPPGSYRGDIVLTVIYQ
ncbi:MAG: hypothetical protein JJU46_09340 [Balneolaceae bacterium]|nr:hypothetical protein [Balneolaceae bacterium]MCH8548666.1 hypothetical protein [Balneolaceae bacterium]